MSAASSSSSPAASTEANVPPPVPAGHAQLYVKNLSFSSTEEGLGAFVEKTIGTKPQSVRIVTRRAGPTATRSRGYGFVTIVEGAKQTGIDKLNNVDFEGRVLAVVEAQPRDPNQPRPPRPPRKPRAPRTSTSTSGDAGASSSSSASSSSPAPKPDRKSFPDATQLYVNNLAFSSTGEELAALFESKLSSKPLDVEIVTFKFGRFKGNSRGFGFVWVANGLVDKALALDKTKLNDRELGVARANAPTASGDDASSSSDASARPRRQRQRRPRNANGDASGSSGDAAITNTSGGDGEAPDNRRRQSGGGESRGRGRGRPRRGSRGGRGGGAAASGSN